MGLSMAGGATAQSHEIPTNARIRVNGEYMRLTGLVIAFKTGRYPFVSALRLSSQTYFQLIHASTVDALTTRPDIIRHYRERAGLFVCRPFESESNPRSKPPCAAIPFPIFTVTSGVPYVVPDLQVTATIPSDRW
jgi:hypothetical protein